METKQLKTPLEVFRYIVEERLLTPDYPFICNNIKVLWELNDMIDEELYHQTMAVLKEHKPSYSNVFAKYTKGEYWYGKYAWWELNDDNGRDKSRYVLSVKYRYLRDLIAHLESVSAQETSIKQ